MTTAEKVRETRLRHTAERQQCTLHRSRRRDPKAWDYGLYWIVTRDGVVLGAGAGTGVVGDAPGLTIDQVENWLMARPAKQMATAS